jgi:hypothetical protein
VSSAEWLIVFLYIHGVATSCLVDNGGFSTQPVRLFDMGLTILSKVESHAIPSLFESVVLGSLKCVCECMFFFYNWTNKV